jgi:hypothetical protein
MFSHQWSQVDEAAGSLNATLCSGKSVRSSHGSHSPDSSIVNWASQYCQQEQGIVDDQWYSEGLVAVAKPSTVRSRPLPRHNLNHLSCPDITRAYDIFKPDAAANDTSQCKKPWPEAKAPIVVLHYPEPVCTSPDTQLTINVPNDLFVEHQVGKEGYSVNVKLQVKA